MTALYISGILLIGFVIYLFVRDYIFDNSDTFTDTFVNSKSIPSPAPIEIRQAPTYPSQVVSSSGPNAPNVAPPTNETVMHLSPEAKDPYYESNESSNIPENLRHPERSFRPPPTSNNTSIAVHSGVASNVTQQSSSQGFQQEFIQGGGEFMPGIFANDTMDDKTFSAF
jgi:hypothetical protein